MTDYDTVGRPEADDVHVRLADGSADVLTQELDGASVALGMAEDVLLAALGRAIERTIGEGAVAVDVPGHGRNMLPVQLSCVGPRRAHATELLAGVHHMAVSRRRIVHGVPDDPHAQSLSDILFAYGDSEPAQLGHVLELRAHRRGGVVVLDWWYDTRSFEPYTIEELAEQLPFTLIELTSEATAPALAAAELAMAH